MKPTRAQLSALYRRKVLNQELSLRELDQRKIELESRPSKVLVELTQNCNFKCIMCSQAWEPHLAKYDPKFNMALKTFKRVADQLFADAYFVDLRGVGESTILPHWPELVDLLSDYPLINWHLVTNLGHPRKEVWEKIVRTGFLLGFSCDGATKETFEAIRVRSHFDKILTNLELVSEAIKREKSGYLYFITVVQKRNYHELPAIVELARRFSVPEVQFKVVRPGEHSEDITLAMREAVSRSIDRALDLALEYGIQLTINDRELRWGVDLGKILKAAQPRSGAPRLNFPPAAELDAAFAKEHDWTEVERRVRDTWKVSSHARCFKADYYTAITYDGRVGTCNHMVGNPDILHMGDLKKQDFAEIWNGEHYQFFRGSLLYNKALDPRCSWCFKHRIED